MKDYDQETPYKWVIQFENNHPKSIKKASQSKSLTPLHKDYDNTPLSDHKEGTNPYEILELESLDSLFRLQKACDDLKNLSLQDYDLKQKNKLLKKVKKVEKGLSKIAKLIHVFNEILRRKRPPEDHL